MVYNTFRNIIYQHISWRLLYGCSQCTLAPPMMNTYMYIDGLVDLLTAENNVYWRQIGTKTKKFLGGNTLRQFNVSSKKRELTKHEGWDNKYATNRSMKKDPDSKVHGTNMGPIWGRQDPGGPHVGRINFASWGCNVLLQFQIWPKTVKLTVYRHLFKNGLGVSDTITQINDGLFHIALHINGQISKFWYSHYANI